jgi:hypothetical protein
MRSHRDNETSPQKGDYKTVRRWNDSQHQGSWVLEFGSMVNVSELLLKHRDREQAKDADRLEPKRHAIELRFLPLTSRR